MEDLGLPREVAQGLGEFVDAAKETLGPDLASVVVFGSAAEGRLRATSDVNLILVLARFDVGRIDALREPLRSANALIRLQCMLMLESEIGAAAEAFAVKFSDIRERHKLIWGKDPFAGLAPSRPAMLTRLNQILLNFILRTRERYAIVSLREEQLALVIADAAAPLRSAAALIMQLEGKPAASPKAALETLAEDLAPGRFGPTLASLSTAREEASLPPGTAKAATLELIELAQALRGRAERLV